MPFIPGWGQQTLRRRNTFASDRVDPLERRAHESRLFAYIQEIVMEAFA
jgi:hypothetical protein